MPPFQFKASKPYNELNPEELTKLQKVHAACDRMLEALDRVCRAHGIRYYLACGNLLGAVRHGGMIPWDDDVDVWMFPSDFEKLKACADELGTDFQLSLPEDYFPWYADCVPRIAYLPSHLHDDPERAERFHGISEHLQLDIFLITHVPAGFRRNFSVFKFLFLYGLANGHRFYIPYKDMKPFQKLCARILAVFGKVVPLKWIVRSCWKLGKKLEKGENYPEVLIFNDDVKAFFRHYQREDFAETTDLPYDGMNVMVPVGYRRVLDSHFRGKWQEFPPPEKQLAHGAALEFITFDD